MVKRIKNKVPLWKVENFIINFKYYCILKIRFKNHYVISDIWGKWPIMNVTEKLLLWGYVSAKANDLRVASSQPKVQRLM